MLDDLLEHEEHLALESDEDEEEWQEEEEQDEEEQEEVQEKEKKLEQNWLVDWEEQQVWDSVVMEGELYWNIIKCCFILITGLPVSYPRLHYTKLLVYSCKIHQSSRQESRLLSCDRNIEVHKSELPKLHKYDWIS